MRGVRGRLQSGRRIVGQREQFAQIRRGPGLFALAGRQKGLALRIFEIERAVEPRIQSGARILRASGRGHGVSSAFSSHARARVQSRCTVRSGVDSASAVSSSVMPAK